MPKPEHAASSIGNMWKRLQIQAPPGWTPPIANPQTITNDFNEQVLPLGQSGDGWTTFAVVWGEVRSLTGRELFLALQIRPDITSKVVIRYWKGIPKLSPQMRFLLATEGRRLNIEYLLPGQKKRLQECLCKEEVF
jgi:SPP1 family predicted phage head-tail adaptor